MNLIPNEYKPISPWGYFGYSIIFNLPLIGLILLIVFSFDNSNINRRNYARSYFCIYLIVIIVLVILLLLGTITTTDITNTVSSVY
jgi:hypothetical protein